MTRKLLQYGKTGQVMMISEYYITCPRGLQRPEPEKLNEPWLFQLVEGAANDAQRSLEEKAAE